MKTALWYSSLLVVIILGISWIPVVGGWGFSLAILDIVLIARFNLFK